MKIYNQTKEVQKVPNISTYLKMGTVQLLSVEYVVNSKFVSTGNEIPITPEIKVEIKKTQENNTSIVSLELKIFKKNTPEYPIWIKMKNQATFEWGNENKNVDTMLKTVGTAHLLSYMRPLITQLTTMSDFPPLTLPLINLSGK